MKITFIRPHLTDQRAADALEPLAFAVLAGLTPPDVELALYDDRLEPIRYDAPTDLAALTVETFTARRAYQIAAQFRQRGVPVIMGGYHPTLLPDEARQHADAIVIGDAESVWPQIVRDAKAGGLQPVYQSATPPDLAGLKVDRRLFQGKRYAPLTPVQFGRGCRFACDFCAIHAFYGASLRQRDVHEVADEIGALGRKFLLLVDDNLFSNQLRAEELFRALIPLKAHWACQVSIDVAQNSHLLDLMARSGCFAALVGLESLEVRNLAQMKKKWNREQGDYAAALAQFSARGIMVCGTFVFGYDYDTPDLFDRTLEFALRAKLVLAQFNTLLPYPTTPLYGRLQAEGRLIYDRWWLDPNFRFGQAMFHPRGMTAAALTEGCFRLRREFNRYSSIFQRALTPQTNCRTPYHLLAFLAANLISRKEIYKKQGQALGLAPKEIA